VEVLKLINDVERLGAAACVLVTHDDKDIYQLTEIANAVSGSIRAIAALTREDDGDSIMTPVIAEKLANATRGIAVATTGHIRAATAVTIDDDNELATEELEKSTDALNAAINGLVSTVGLLNPAVRQCDSSGLVMQNLSADLDEAMANLDSFNKEPLNKALADY
jgi:hypothetical protein